MALLEMRNITKSFAGVAANDDVSLTVQEGSVHALLGENGAGKTTLMNILYGLYQAESGKIFWEGKEVQFAEPKEAIEQGIGMVHQHFMLVRNMTVLQNIILGLRPKGYPFIDLKAISEELTSISEKYGLVIDIQKRIDELSVGEQQRVEILKTLYRKAKLLILDEPTAVLTPQETGELFGVLRSLCRDGHSVILISHRLAEIMDVSDEITVLRDGKSIATLKTAACTKEELSRLMIGCDLKQEAVVHRTDPAEEEILGVRDLTLAGSGEKPLLDHVNLAVRRGEILGIAGVDGNGQNYLAEVICGIRTLNDKKQDALFYKGKSMERWSIKRRYLEGISYIPDDRHRDGLVLDSDVKDNYILRDYNTPRFSLRGVLKKGVIEESVQEAVERFDIHTKGIQERVGNLSGGNQQKIILSREIRDEAELLIAMQPTRGLDIGAASFVHDRLIEMRKNRKGILLISTDLDEIMKLSDRIAVIFEGRIMGILPNTEELSIEMIGLMMGGHPMEEVMNA